MLEQLALDRDAGERGGDAIGEPGARRRRQQVDAARTEPVAVGLEPIERGEQGADVALDVSAVSA